MDEELNPLLTVSLAERGKSAVIDARTITSIDGDQNRCEIHMDTGRTYSCCEGLDVVFDRWLEALRASRDDC